MPRRNKRPRHEQRRSFFCLFLEIIYQDLFFLRKSTIMTLTYVEMSVVIDHYSLIDQLAQGLSMSKSGPVHSMLTRAIVLFNGVLILYFCFTIGLSMKCETTKIKMVWTHDKGRRTCQDSPPGNSERRKKERKTKRRWEDNITEWTGLKFPKAVRRAEN